MNQMPDISSDVLSSLQAVVQLEKEGRFQEALNVCSQLLQVAPNLAPLLHLTGLAHGALGNHENAIDYLERAMETDYNPEICFELGRLYSSVNRTQAFLDTHLPKLVTFYSFQECLNIGNDLLQKGCYEGAEAALGRARELIPTAYHAIEQYMRSLFQNGKYTEAYNQYLELLKLNGTQSTSRELVLGDVMNMRDYCHRCNSAKYNHLRDATPCELEKPVYWGQKELSESDTRIIGIAPEAYLAEIQNITFISNGEFLIGEDNQIIHNLAVHPHAERYDLKMSDHYVKCYDRKKMLLDLPPETESRLDIGILMSGLTGKAWAHWLLEYASLFWNTDQFSKYDNVPLLVDERTFKDPHTRAAFEKLSKSHPIFTLKPNKRYFCKQLIVPSKLIHLPHDVVAEFDYTDAVISELQIEFLRDKLHEAPEAPITDKKRIYIPRKSGASAPYRHLRNETEVEKVFAEFGFVSIEPHRLSYEDKVKLFQSAEAIAGGNGSGFLNSFYSPAGTKIITLITRYNLKQALSPTIYKHLKQPSTLIMCDAIEDSYPDLPHHSDYIANLDHVRKVLTELFG